MSTEAQPSEPDDHPGHRGGLTAFCGRYLRRQYLLVALGLYMVLALFGVYADWKFWSYFDLQYPRYAGFGDYLLAPVSFLRLLIDPSFVVVLVIFGVILLLLATCGGYLFTMIWNFTRRKPSGKEPAPTGGTLPLTEHWHEQESFRSYLRTRPARPRWAVPILAIAAILAINVNAAAERRDLRGFAKLIQHAYETDHYQRPRQPYSRYDVVSVGMLAPTEQREHVVRLRSTERFVLYYDVLDDRPVVVSSDRVLSEVADANLGDPTSPATPAGQMVAAPAPTAADTSVQAAPDGAIPPQARSVAPDVRLPVQQSLASEPAQPAEGIASSSQIAPPAAAGERVAAGQIMTSEVIPAMDGAAGDERGGTPATPPEQPPAPPVTTFPLQPSAAPDPAALPEELDAIGSNVRHSQGSLDGLKSYLQQMESSFVEIHKFVTELDDSLKVIDQAFEQLAEQQVAVEQDPYADCPELTATQPLEFGAGDATLSLEAVGWLFQSRRQLTAERSAERGQWLVIEGHADATAGQPGVEPPLAIKRADAVREFLQSELGVSTDAMKIVGKGIAGPGARLVSLYDCLERQPAAAPATTTTASTTAATKTAVTTTIPTTSTAKLGLVQSAAAGEVGDTGPVRPAAWTAGTEADGLLAMLADLDARPQERGLLVTVPGDRLFGTDSSQIESSAYGILGEIAEALTHEADRHALIIGHSDAIGDADYNRVLSQRRARAVRDFLVDNYGIASSRLSVEGRGEDDPIATNDTLAGRLANRRVEVVFLN